MVMMIFYVNLRDAVIIAVMMREDYQQQLIIASYCYLHISSEEQVELVEQGERMSTITTPHHHPLHPPQCTLGSHLGQHGQHVR